MNGRVRHQIMISLLLGLAAPAGQTIAGARGPASEPPPPTNANREASSPPAKPASGLAIPESIRAEHQEIHSALERAAQAPGRLGSAAKKLSAILLPHFEREEEIAQPPLGLLATLAANEPLPKTVETDVLAMTVSLRTELRGMLQEHEQIRAAVEELRLAAEDANSPEHVKFAEELALHARTEEEVLYPAAILVGDIIRMRQKGGK